MHTTEVPNNIRVELSIFFKKSIPQAKMMEYQPYFYIINT